MKHRDVRATSRPASPGFGWWSEGVARGAPDRLTLAAFAATAFLGALLLFSVQPILGRMLLPVLGGSPNVWNTCVVFFQAALLLGYVYAHSLTTRCAAPAGPALHVAAAAAAASLLPIGISQAGVPPAHGDPIPWLVGVLLSSAALPFLVLAATAPLLQAWLARTGSRDPYALYAASSAGSLTAVLGYPFVVEPRLTLSAQNAAWTASYAVFVVLLGGCAARTWRGSRFAPPTVASRAGRPTVERITGGRRLRWIGLAFVPAALLLAVTTHLTTDVAPVPLLWLVPLALYLATFTLAFSRWGSAGTAAAGRLLPACVVVAALVLAVAAPSIDVLVAVNLVLLLCAGAVGHGRLAEDRPHPRRLTEFYLWISLGGVLGGAFSGLAAPLVLETTAEYPVSLLLCCLLLPGAEGRRRVRALPQVAIGLGLAALGWLLLDVEVAAWRLSHWRWLPFVLLSLLALTLRRQPIALAAAVALLLIGTSWYAGAGGHDALVRERTFFGVLAVQRTAGGHYHDFTHGTTLHGRQARGEREREHPQAYYAREGPVGQLFEALPPLREGRPVAVIGLGTGTLAAYGVPRQEMTFYELDPAVARLAQDVRYFTYLADSPARLRIVLGDGRLRLEQAPSAHYGAILVDAFSSDAVPIHLLTREAVRAYLDKLAPGGVLVFHVSNRSLVLEPVVRALAEDAGLVGIVQNANGQGSSWPATWIALARSRGDLGMLRADPRWQRLEDVRAAPLWTDDYVNLVSVVDWSR